MSPAGEMGPAVRHDLGTTWPGYVSIMVWPGRCRQPGRGGALAAAVGVAFDDKLVAGGGEPVDGGLGQQRVGHEREPLLASRLEVTTVEARRWRSVMIS